MTLRLAVSLCALAAAGLVACDDHDDGAEPRLRVEAVGLEIPRLSGWVPDPEVTLADPDAGGTALQLIRKSAPPGSPRIRIELGKKGAPLTLDAFLNQNLKAMGDIERTTAMRIIRVNQEPLRIGPRRAFLVRHEYTMGRGDAQIAFTQLSTVMVIDGRGVAVTALGRTELFHPLADSITRMLTGLSVTTDGLETATEAPAPSPPEATAPPVDVQPIDLGTVGGK